MPERLLYTYIIGDDLMGKIENVNEVEVSALIPYINNAKKHSDEQVDKIAASIREFGFLNPVLIDKNLNIIAGHGRVMAAKKLGLQTVPCAFIEGLSEAQRKAYILADNRLGELAEWDMELVNLELEGLEELGFDTDLTGFDFNPDPEEPEHEIVEDEVPEEVETRCKPGDLWKLGEHRLICGDSTDINVVEKLMGDQKADMLLTDPPYNVDYEGKTKDALKIKNDKMDNDTFRQFLRDAFNCANSVMRGGAVFYIWHADSEGYNFRGACADNDWKVRECLIWHKNTMVLGRQDYQWKHEPCLYGWKDGASHLWASDRKQTTILNFDKPARSELHPTMKPVGLFAYQISNNTHEGDNVLDLFCGSGTTLVACEQLKRRCFAVELDPKYADVIIQRWENLTGQTAELIQSETEKGETA